MKDSKTNGPETIAPEEVQSELDTKPLGEGEQMDGKQILRFSKEGQLTLEEFADE